MNKEQSKAWNQPANKERKVQEVISMKFKKAIVFLLAMVLIGSSCPLEIKAEGQSLVIQSLDEVADLDANAKINEQIIVIYKDQATISSLALTGQDIKGG